MSCSSSTRPRPRPLSPKRADSLSPIACCGLVNGGAARKSRASNIFLSTDQPFCCSFMLSAFPNLLHWFALGVIILTIVGVAVGRLPFLRMNRTTIALAGATGLIVIGAISLDKAYAALDLNTLTLLFAMMVVNVNLRRGGFFQLV